MSRFALWIMFVLVMGLLAIAFLTAVPDVYQGILDNILVDVFVRFVTDNPESVALGMLATFSALFIICTVVYFVANRRERERVGATYAVNPTAWRD